MPLFQSQDLSSLFRRDFDKSIDRWGFSPREYQNLPLGVLWELKLGDDTTVTIQNVRLAGESWKTLAKNAVLLKHLADTAAQSFPELRNNSGPPSDPIDAERSDIGIGGCSPFSIGGSIFNGLKMLAMFGSMIGLGIVLIKLLIAYVAVHGAHIAPRVAVSLVRSFLNKEDMKTAIKNAAVTAALGDILGHFYHDFLPWLAEAVSGNHSNSSSGIDHSHHTPDGKPTFGEGNGGYNGCYQCGCPKFVDDGSGNCIGCKAFGYYNHTYYNHAG